ncbi:apolipoprotein A1/A4/E family protein, partial [Pseudomonas sp. TNT2022 ID681]|nr:apolipoprotein A1/A4/E family protein [Pseudomonas fontis]MDD0990191.1 apolipoprotein A1/A4/E family protein [Pseudomonas fontis]
MHHQWAEQLVSDFEPQTGDGPPVFTDPSVERQQAIERHVENNRERLEERYHEPQRAAYHAEYEREDALYQTYIDRNAEAYAALCNSTAFSLIEQHDYDGDDPESGGAYCKTMALCLAGGISEAPSSTADAQGPSEALWLKWLNDPQSPAYRVLLMRDQALLGALLPSFSATGETDWRDSEKLYSALNKFLSSDDMGVLLRNSLKQSIADALGAVNAASSRLKPLLGPGVQRAVMRLNTASQWLHNGVKLVELQLEMKLSEYYALQSAHLREMQQKANAAIAKARERMHAGIDGLGGAVRKVRPIIQEGLLSLAVLDPKLANTSIKVSVWVEGSAEELQRRLASAGHAVDTLSEAAHGRLSKLSVAVGSLEPAARQVLQDVRVSAQQAKKMVRASFGGLRGVAGSLDLLLSLGGLYLLSDSLNKNMEKAEVAVRDKSTEALLALHGSQMALLGSGIEAVGLIFREGSKGIINSQVLGSSGTEKAKTLFKSADFMVRTGALINAASGIYDAYQLIHATVRTTKSGDLAAAKGGVRNF